MVIDFRTRPPYKGFVTEGNFFPRPMEDQFADPTQVPGIYMGSVGIESARTGDMELYWKELSCSGIDLQVVQGRWVRPGMAQVSNDDVCEMQQRWPDKFLAFPAVDPADPAGAVAEIRRCHARYGIRGICLEPGWAMPPKYVDDFSLFPIYDLCAQLGLVCAFTLSVLAGEDLSYCNPLNLQRVAQQFPTLKIAVSHGCWPFVQEFLGMALKCQNVYFYPDFFLNIPQMPFGDQFVRAANSFMRYRMMFATSYPVRPLAQSLEAFLALPFEEEVLPLLLADNARRLLGLERITRLTVFCLLAYAVMKGYSFFTGANHVGWEIPKGTPGALFSAGWILPLNVCVGVVVAATIFSFYLLFSQED